MKRLGLTLISASFLAGAYLAVLDATDIAWTPFVAILVGGFVGVGLLRQATRTEAAEPDRIESNTALMRESLARVVSAIEEMIPLLDTMNIYDIPAEIDRRLLDDLNTFASNRDSIKHAFGLQAFADVMSPYAGGERYLNRVWSASADGYIDEAREYLPRSLDQFREAVQVLGRLSAERSAS